MPNFHFRVGTADGQIAEREIQAMDLAAARDEIRRQGLHVFHVRQSGRSVRDLFQAGGKVSTEKFLLFNQELLALVRAGLPIIQSFDIMLERQKETKFRQVLTEIRDKIQSGVALSDAFASFGSMFPAIYSTSLRAGERSGDLEGVIRRFLRYQKLIVNLRKKVLGALIYPAVLVTLSLVMITVMLTVVIPKFSDFYTGFGATLPWFTRVLISFSVFLRHNFPLFAVGIVLAFFLLRRWAASEHGRQILDAVKLKIPFVGATLHRFAILQFMQSMSTLLGGGTPMVPSIEIASQSITNKFIAGRIGPVAQQVREGESLWRSLEDTKVMSDLAVEMVKVGESTGALVEMLNNVSEFYDEEIEAQLQRMVTMIEPMILVFLGVVIAALLYAFYLPMFRLVGLGQN